MSRSAFHICVEDSVQAFEFYQKVFDAKLLCRYDNADGTVYHSELEAYGQIMMVTGLAEGRSVAGNTMMFVMQFSEGDEDIIRKIYDLLKEDANIICPLGSCDYSPLQTELIDKFGVHWCILVYENCTAV